MAEPKVTIFDRNNNSWHDKPAKDLLDIACLTQHVVLTFDTDLTIATATPTDIEWNIDKWTSPSHDASFWDGPSSEFNALYNGLMRVEGRIVFAAETTPAGTRAVGVKVNGTTVKSESMDTSAIPPNGKAVLNFNFLIHVAFGDVVKIFVQHGQGSDLDILEGDSAPNQSWCSVSYVRTTVS